MKQVTVNHFDRSKLFYPLVMQYVAQLIGIKELVLRGVAGPGSFEDLLGRITALGNVSTGSDAEVAGLHDAWRKLSGPLKLRSEYQGNSITIDIDEIAREFVTNHSYLLPSTMRVAGALLILAHEQSKDAPWHDSGPLWEFLRHCRNAAAHGGVFHMLHGEPSCPAHWGPFVITENLQGTPLFKDATGTGLLSPGDPIRLLWDIEQEYPHMSV